MAGTRRMVAALALAAACAGGEGRGEDGAQPGTTGGTSGGSSSTGAPEPTTGESTGGGTTGVASVGSSGEVVSTGLATTSSTGEALTGSTTGSSSTGTTGEPAGCGDGVVQAPETCDDGNAIDSDGCNADCTPSGALLWSTTFAGMLGLADEAWSCAVDGNGSIHVAGFVGVGPGNEDLWVRKYSSAGEVMWTQTHAGSAMAKDAGRAIVVDAAELVYVAGVANVLMQDNDVFVRKYAAEGSVDWTKSYAGAAMLSDVGSAAALTPSGDLIVGGATSVVDNGNDTWLRKYSPAGAVLWTRTYNGAAKLNDATNAVAVTSDGYIYAAGYEAVVGESNNFWVGKYDADGNLLWSRLANGGISKADYLHGAVAMDDGGVVVCGYETASGIPWKSFMRRYDASGLMVWTEIEDGPTAEGALCYGIDRAANGDLLFAGATMQAAQREPWLRRLADDGTEKWSTVVAGTGTGASHARVMREAPDGTLVAAGTMDEGVDGRDVWVARFSP